MKKQLNYQSKFFNSNPIKYKKMANTFIEGLNNFYDLSEKYIFGEVVDIGNGGIISFNINKAKSVTLVDIAKKTLMDIRILSKGKLIKLKNNNIKKVTASVLDLPFPKNSFDTVIMITTAHHLSESSKSNTIFNINKAFNEINRVLNKNGIFLLVECCPTFPFKIIQELLFETFYKIIIKYSKPLPYFLSKSQIIHYLNNNNFYIDNIINIDPPKKMFISTFSSFMAPGWLWNYILPSRLFVSSKSK